MRVFVASLATETNTFSPLYVDRSAFESAFYCPPGTHPDTPTLCSAPVVAARRRAASGRLHADRRNGDLGRAGRARVARGLREPARRDPRAARGRAAGRHRALRPARRDGRARLRRLRGRPAGAGARRRRRQGGDRRRTRHALPSLRPDGRRRRRDRRVQGIPAHGFPRAGRRPGRPLPARRTRRDQAGRAPCSTAARSPPS